jgi:hypothetical protein
MLSKEQTEKITQKYYPDLMDCINPGWEDYKTIFQAYQHRFEIRTRASIVRDLIIDNVRKKFYNNPNTRIIESPNGLFILSFEDIVFARFKKIKPNFTTSNIYTKQAIQFTQGELFPEFIEKILVNIGYMVDKNWDKQGTYICCPKGKFSYSWFIDISKNGLLNNKEAINLDFPEEDDNEDINEIKKIMYPKEEKEVIIKKLNTQK